MADDLTPDLDELDDGHELVEPSNLVKVAVPFLALGAAFAVRKVMDVAYEKATGHRPPSAMDPDVSLRRALIYSAATAAAIAIVNVAIDRLSAPKRVPIA